MGDMSAAEPLQQLRLKFLSDLRIRELLTPSMTMSGGGELEVEMIRKGRVCLACCDGGLWQLVLSKQRGPQP